MKTDFENWIESENKKTLSSLAVLPLFNQMLREAESLEARLNSIQIVGLNNGYLYRVFSDLENQFGRLERCKLHQANSQDWQTVFDFNIEKQNYFHEIVFNPFGNTAILDLGNYKDKTTVLKEIDLDDFTIKTGFEGIKGVRSVSWLDEDTLAVVVSNENGPGKVHSDELPSIATTPQESHFKVFFCHRNGKSQEIKIPILEFNQSPQIHVYSGNRIIVTLLLSDWRSVSYEFDGSEFTPMSLSETGRSFRLWKDYRVFLHANSLRVEKCVDNSTWKTHQEFSWDDFEAEYFKVMSQGIFIQGRQGGLQSARLLVEEVSHLKIVDIELPKNMSLREVMIDCHVDLEVFVFEGFDTPRRFYYFESAQKLTELTHLTEWKLPELQVERFMFNSADGTQVPCYFICKQGAGISKNTPLLSYVYGGFGISTDPIFISRVYEFWIKRGGAIVFPCPRGGREFGSQWHTGAVGLNKRRTFEDIQAVIQGIHNQGISSPARTGIYGGSNGGMVALSMALQYPDLFAAAYSENGLLDVLTEIRTTFNGRRWQEEFGNPNDPEIAQYIQTYSPMGLIEQSSIKPLQFFIYCSADDEIVPSTHSENFAQRLSERGLSYYFYRSETGSHRSNAFDSLTAMESMKYTFFWTTLM